MCTPECIVYTWDYHTSQSIWTGLRVQPILSDEVQTFKALILVHKVLQEGHQVVSRPQLRSGLRAVHPLTNIAHTLRSSRKLKLKWAGSRLAHAP